MSYMTETRPATSKTQRYLATNDMCTVENINTWAKHRKEEWNQHISRMSESRLVRKPRDKSPSGKSVRSPRKRCNDNLRAE